MKKRNWIIAIVAIALIVGCIIWETMSLVVSIVAIVFYALITMLFVAPSLENLKDDTDGK